MALAARARVLVADGRPVVRVGVRGVLDADPALDVVAEAGDGHTAVDRAAALAVDLAVVDLAVPPSCGVSTTREIRRRRPATRVLVLSVHEDGRRLGEVMASGAAGYLPTSTPCRDLVQACRAVLAGRRFVHPRAWDAAVADHLRRRRAARARGRALDPDGLSPREVEVVRLVAQGRTTAQIAAALVISPKTVDRHRCNALAVLGLHDRVDLTRHAIRRGLVDP